MIAGEQIAETRQECENGKANEENAKDFQHARIAQECTYFAPTRRLFRGRLLRLLGRGIVIFQGIACHVAVKDQANQK